MRTLLVIALTIGVFPETFGAVFKFKDNTVINASIYEPTSGTDYVVGLAYKVNDQINLALATARGQSTDDGSLANALAPFKGSSSNIIGGSFKVNDNVEINASYALINFGDANANVVAGSGPFENNKGTRVSIGTKIIL